MNKMDPFPFTDNILNTHIWKVILQLLCCRSNNIPRCACPKAKCSR